MSLLKPARWRGGRALTPIENPLLRECELLLRARTYDGQGTWYDESGNGHDATVSGPTFVGYFQFLTATDKITIPNHAGLNFGATESYTLMATARMADATPTSNNYLVTKKQDNSNNTAGYCLCWNTGGNVLPYVADGTGDPYHVDTKGPMRDGMINVLGMVRDYQSGSVDYLEAFLNGDGSNSPANMSVEGTHTSSTDMIIGELGSGINDFYGDIWSVALWRRALTDNEMQYASAALREHGEPAATFYNIPWKQPHQKLVDEFNGTDSDPWSVDWELSNDGTGGNDPDISSNRGRCQTTDASAASRALYKPAVGPDFEMLYSFQFNETTGVHSTNVGFRGNRIWETGGLNFRQTNCYFFQKLQGTQTFKLYRYDGSETQLAEKAMTSGTSKWWVRVRAIGDRILVRVWQGTEPSTWDFDVTDSTYKGDGVNFCHLTHTGNTGTKTIFYDELEIWSYTGDSWRAEPITGSRIWVP